MGIPHLITHLRPYAVGGDLTGRAVVIDGPSFAYHIFHLCLATKQDAKNPFEATPSYALLARTAIQWLDSLRLKDVKLQKIYFDGFLPASKKDIRCDRLKSYTKQLSTYQESWPQNMPTRLDSPRSMGNVELFAPKSVPHGLSKIPAAPFLVPTIIEALQKSPLYRDIAEVVPGEADLYCARYLKEHGGIALTSDSDLLVHELGPDGSVCFLGDVLLVSTRGVMSIRCLEYKLRAISKRLGLSENYSIKALAFEILLDVHASMPQLLERAIKLRAVTSRMKEYEDFSLQYSPLPSDLLVVNPTVQVLRGLDPRTSEYVLQFPFFAHLVGLQSEHLVISNSSAHGRTAVEVFMPFLLDCPAKTSAWESSTATRQLAYGLLNLVLPANEQIFTIVEHRRVQHSKGGREWQLPSTEQLQEACEDILSSLRSLREKSTERNQDVWRALVMQQDLIWSSAMNKVPLSIALIEKVSKGQALRASWDIVHFLGQVHGSFYSFRILQQITSLLSTCGQSLPVYVQHLHDELQSFPSFVSLESLDEISDWLPTSDAKNTLNIAREISGLSVTAIETPKESKQERKKRKREAATHSSTIPNKKSANMFDLLATD